MSSAIRRVLCHSTEDHPDCAEALRTAAKGLRAAGFEVLESFDPEDLPDLIVLLGGDGFLMESLRAFDCPEVPIFGINFGTVGFLMNSHQCIDELPAILTERRFSEVSHCLLGADLVDEEGVEVTTFAFNEFVLERQTGQAVRLRVSIDGESFNRFAGDGFVVSSSAGSTAYNLAAGGPAVHPAVQALIMTPLYPHRAEPFHSVQFSLMLPLTAVIEVEAEELAKRHMRVVADGLPFRNIARVRIHDSGRRVRLLRTPDRGFTRLLSEKFIGQ